MKRLTIITLVTLIAINLIFAGISFLRINSFKQTSLLRKDNDDDNDIIPLTSAKGRVIIYVNSTIYANITNEVNQYKQDIINNNSYTVKIINNTMFTNAFQLRTNLTAEYGLGLKGAVFIGEFPYLWYNDMNYPDVYGKYPCDLYLMDLDASWWDTIPDGIYDDHNTNPPAAPGSDVQPEIFVARINPLPLSGINQTEKLKEYFKRNHEYRTGKLSRPDKGLLYMDDEWAKTVDIPGWTSWFTLYTGAERIVHCNNGTTTPTNYKNNLTLNYEWVHLLSHSNETDHLFGMVLPGTPTAVEGTFDTATLNTLNTQPLFYNLYACYNGNYTHKDSLGTQYLFSNNTLAVLCSSKAGGMDLYKYFYDPLKNGQTIGDSFVTWFNNPDPLITNSINGKLVQRRWHGMTILGDPLLTVKPASTGPGALPAGDDDDDDDDRAAIPFGNYYIIFAIITIISLIIIIKRKEILNKKKL